MKFTCTTEHLKDAVLTVERFTGRHVTIPTLSHILISVREKKIFLSATNLEVAIEYAIPGKVHKTGSVTTPAKSITQILQFLPDETITLEAEKHELTLHTPSSEVTIFGLNPSEFPKLPDITPEHTFQVLGGQMTGALGRVVLAAAHTDIKPVLAGIFMAAHPGAIVFVATDSFRLAEHTLANQEGIRTSVECIMPARVAQELIRIVPADAELEVRVGEHQVLFSWGEQRILSRLIDGSYPPYRTIIPPAYETTLVVAREELEKKIRLAAVFSSRLNDVTLRFTPSELEITTSNAEAGGTSARVAVKGRGKSGSAMFNHRYLSDGVDAAGGEHVTLNLNGSSGATLIQNPTDSAYRYLVMPIRSV